MIQNKLPDSDLNLSGLYKHLMKEKSSTVSKEDQNRESSS